MIFEILTPTNLSDYWMNGTGKKTRDKIMKTFSYPEIVQ